MAALELSDTERMNWSGLLADIKSKGVRTSVLVRSLGTRKATLIGWQTRGYKLRFEDGLRLLNVWSIVKGVSPVVGLKLSPNEVVDWFRVMVDLQQVGFPNKIVARTIGIPDSTLIGWKLELGRPDFERALRLLNYWSEHTGKPFKDIPVYNPSMPHLRFQTKVH